MKKTFLLIIGIVFIYMFLGNIITSKKLIPDDAIRIRVIPNSNSTYDQEMKKLVKEELQTDMYNLLKDVKGSSDARRVINNNLENVNPEKEYKGLKYDEGYYESLLVTIGEGAGDNWWCVLFPPLCLIEAEESTDVEYTSFVKELVNKYM